jgi:hypothetical protein
VSDKGALPLSSLWLLSESEWVNGKDGVELTGRESRIEEEEEEEEDEEEEMCM